MSSDSLILQVENDADDVFITRRAFKKAGITNRIASVENGEEAIAYLFGKDRFSNRDDYPLPSVILLDWNMPLMSGSEFLRWLRAQSGMRRIPVVVLTSSDNENDMIQAYELGSNGFLVKPPSLEDFQALATAFAAYWLGWNRSDFNCAKKDSRSNPAL